MDRWRGVVDASPVLAAAKPTLGLIFSPEVIDEGYSVTRRRKYHSEHEDDDDHQSDYDNNRCDSFESLEQDSSDEDKNCELEHSVLPVFEPAPEVLPDVNQCIDHVTLQSFAVGFLRYPYLDRDIPKTNILSQECRIQNKIFKCADKKAHAYSAICLYTRIIAPRGNLKR